MEIVSKRNFVILIAALLVVGFGLMSLYLNKKIKTQTVTETSTYTGPAMSESDEVEEIETDLENTDIEAIDKDLEDMERELQAL